MLLGDTVLIITDFSVYFGPKSSSPSIDFLFISWDRKVAFHQIPIDTEVGQRSHEDVLSLSANRQVSTFTSYVEWRFIGSAETRFVEK